MWRKISKKEKGKFWNHIRKWKNAENPVPCCEEVNKENINKLINDESNIFNYYFLNQIDLLSTDKLIDLSGKITMECISKLETMLSIRDNIHKIIVSNDVNNELLVKLDNYKTTSSDEKSDNAEVCTPIVLTDKM